MQSHENDAQHNTPPPMGNERSPDGLPPIADSGETGRPKLVGPESGFHSVASENVQVERVVGYIVAVVLTAGVVAGTAPFFFLTEGRAWVIPVILLSWVLSVAILFGLAHWWPPTDHRNTAWRLDEQGMEIRRGVFWKHRIAIPTARVQHVDVSQGPLERAFGVGKLTIHTAGTKNASIELGGLQHAVAMQLRDQLIEQKESLHGQ